MGRDQGNDLRDRGRPDLLVLPDLGTVKGCEARCLLTAPHLCLGDPASATRRCVECLQDSHCFNNPGALGPRCDRNRKRCVCLGDSDCFENLRGRRCETVEGICTCRADSDCRPAFPRCAGAGKARVCTRPCARDGDCLGAAASRCEISTGRCVACSADAHCQADPAGSRCAGGQCGCAGADQCKGSYPWGGHCLSGGRCGCKADADCKDNPHGPICHKASGRCSCGADAQCTGSAAHALCALAHSGAGFNHCQAPCKSDSGCAAKLGLARCSAGKCVGCLKDSDCAGSPSPRCDTTARRCVGCLQDAHCPVATPYCAKSTGVCGQCRTRTARPAWTARAVLVAGAAARRHRTAQGARAGARTARRRWGAAPARPTPGARGAQRVPPAT